VVAGPEVTDVGGLKVADFRTAFLLRQARGRVFLGVLPAVMEQQQHCHAEEEASCHSERHA